MRPPSPALRPASPAAQGHGRRRAPRRGPNPAQPRRSARRRSTILIALAIVVPQLTLAVVLAYTLDLIPHRGSLAQAKSTARDAETSLRAGDCVRADPFRSQFYVPTPCGDRRVTGRVVALVSGQTAATESCPETTDFFATRPGRVVCLRRSGDPHPGDPGQGGGVFRRGDCVISDGTTGVREVPCGSPTVFETVAGRAASAAACRLPAVRYATLKGGALPILCLGDGPGLASPGECVGDPERLPVTFEAIPCGDGAAKAKVLSRAPIPARCLGLPGQTHYVNDPNGLPASAVVCLSKIR
jgi:hypothetical protein